MHSPAKFSSLGNEYYFTGMCLRKVLFWNSLTKLCNMQFKDSEKLSFARFTDFNWFIDGEKIFTPNECYLSNHKLTGLSFIFSD